MTQDQFLKIQDKLFAEILAMGQTKGQEYANNRDRFANFKEVAQDIGITPVQVLMVFVTKHFRSLEQYARSGKVLSNESIHSRILDIMTYMSLLEGIIQEEESNEFRT